MYSKFLSHIAPPASNGKASQDRPVLHSAASQQAGVAGNVTVANLLSSMTDNLLSTAPQPKAPATPVVTKQVVPAPQKMIRKMQAVTKPPPQAAPKPAAMQSPVKTIPQTPQQQNKQSLALPVVSTRQNSSSASAAAAGYHTTHERWIPPAAPAPAPAPATSQKAAGKKPEAKAADLIFPLAKASEAKPPVIKTSESKGPAAVKVAESKSTNSLPSVPPPSRVDASASSKPATASSASNSTWQTPAANTTWQPTTPAAAVNANTIWQPSGAPAAAPALSSSTSSASASAASSQSQMFWRPQQPQEKAKQEEKPRKQIEPAPAAAPASSHHSSSSTKKGGKKNKAKATVQMEEVPDDEAVAKDALPLDSRYLLEPVGGAPPTPAEPKPTKPSPFFDKVLKFDGDGGDDGSSDGTVRVGKKHKERKASIPPEWGSASASANMTMDNKHVRWSPNTALPSSMFNPHPAAPSAMSASDPGEHFWKAATEQLSSPQKKAAALPKKQIVENEFDRIAREALQSLSSGR